MDISASVIPVMAASVMSPQIALRAGGEGASVNDAAEQIRTRSSQPLTDARAAQDDRDEPRSEGSSTGGRQQAALLTADEQQAVRELAARDREVRAHEQAHANVGGQYAGAPTYTYQRGPDGVQYAVGGEVPIDVSAVAGDPQATIEKARIVRRAALAPAEPSPQDRSVAAEATALEQQARAELIAQAAAEARAAAEAANAENATTVFYVPIDILA